MTNSTHIRVAWKVSSLSLKIASIRYRALIPIIALKDYQCESTIFSSSDPKHLENIDVLVIVKPVSPHDYAIAQVAASRGIPIIYDLCDNIFIETYKSKLGGSPADLFTTYAQNASSIVATTPTLAEIVRQATSPNVTIHTIPDGIETPDILHKASSFIDLAKAPEKNLVTIGTEKAKRLIGHLRSSSPQQLIRLFLSRQKKLLPKKYHRLRSSTIRLIRSLHWRKPAKTLYRLYVKFQLAAFSHGVDNPTQRHIDKLCAQNPISEGPENENVKRILWFGNHGAEHAKFGILDLLEIRESLEKIADEFTTELVVVSNNRKKYEENIKPFLIPSRYVEWSTTAAAQEFGRADVVIVPNSLDDFSRCKSANRTVLALSHNVPVVATYSSALNELRDCIMVDDFYNGIKCYFADREIRDRHLAQAKVLLDQYYGQHVIGQKWRRTLEVAIADRTIFDSNPIDIIIFLHLMQDLDLALPIIKEIQQRHLKFQIWCSAELVGKSPRTINRLSLEKWSFQVISNDLAAFNACAFPAHTKCLLSVVETSLGPHRLAKKITDVANELGIYTATLQHGLENVGLTYNDELQAVKKVSFASKRVYLWGELNTLHHDVSPQTRNKCLPVGCPKPSHPNPADLPPHLLGSAEIVIGVFENLHWHRYSDEYRSFFISGIERLAVMFPSVTFLVKPHNAGMWLTSQFEGAMLNAANLIIADPRDPKWEAFTANDLLGHLSAVITTPSTVALDAARYELPVAVVWHTLLLENYLPLFAISSEGDWENFVQQTLLSSDVKDLIERGRQFTTKSLVSGPAAPKIVDDLLLFGASKAVST
ncbi:MAG TPA: hypothetical protein VFM32_08045 [Spongiibacteraceae bacterium]|nr:hypothetical protein [Spongiibacteraceae bacterium]